MVNKVGDRVDASKAIDVEESVRTGRELVHISWRKHLDEVLNGGEVAEEVGRRDEEVVDGEEVTWARKVKATAGKDGLTIEMMNREMLVDVWWELFNWCRLNEMVPSVWKSSVVVPVPNKTRRACKTV